MLAFSRWLSSVSESQGGVRAYTLNKRFFHFFVFLAPKTGVIRAILCLRREGVVATENLNGHISLQGRLNSPEKDIFLVRLERVRLRDIADEGLGVPYLLLFGFRGSGGPGTKSMPQIAEHGLFLFQILKI